LIDDQRLGRKEPNMLIGVEQVLFLEQQIGQLDQEMAGLLSAKYGSAIQRRSRRGWWPGN
jgi:hypothetical protein